MVFVMYPTISPRDASVQDIQPTHAGVRRIDAKVVADALGGELSPERIEGQPGPITRYALRQELLQRRQSRGGRPGIEGTSFRAKIPVEDEDWQRLEALATLVSAEGFSPSPGQVASVLLALALRSVAPDPASSPQGPGSQTAVLSKELAARLAAERSR
jgi:hypothetical protein